VVLADFGSVKLDAFSQWPPGMPPMFFVNRAAPPDRCRYTLAHEIGHIVMHYIPTTDMEREADRFAAEFLMPKKEIIGEFGRFNLERAAAMKQYWKVAMSALIRRAHDLGKITDAQYRRMMTMMSSRGWRMSEPVQIPHEAPTVVRSVIDLHMSVHGYSVEQLCKMTLANMADFMRQWMPSEPEVNRTPLRIVR
jgi:Zn-dependent peptidase ImmA (M78 family)